MKYKAIIHFTNGKELIVNNLDKDKYRFIEDMTGNQTITIHYTDVSYYVNLANVTYIECEEQ